MVQYWSNVVRYRSNIGPILANANIGPTLANVSLQCWSNIVTNIDPTLGRNIGPISCVTWVIQLIKFWPSCATGKGVCGGAKFLAPPYYSQRAVFASLRALFVHFSRTCSDLLCSSVCLSLCPDALPNICGDFHAHETIHGTCPLIHPNYFPVMIFVSVTELTLTLTLNRPKNN